MEDPLYTTNPPAIYPLPTCLLTSWEEHSLSTNNYVTYSISSTTATPTKTTIHVPTKSVPTETTKNDVTNNSTITSTLAAYVSSPTGKTSTNALSKKRFCSCGVSSYRMNCGTLYRSTVKRLPGSSYGTNPLTIKPTELIWWMSTVNDTPVRTGASMPGMSPILGYTAAATTSSIPPSFSSTGPSFASASVLQSNSMMIPNLHTTAPMSPVQFVKTYVLPSKDGSGRDSSFNSFVLPPVFSSSSSSSSPSVSPTVPPVPSTSPIFNPGSTMNYSRFLISSLPRFTAQETNTILPAETIRLYLCSTHISTKITSAPHITLDIPLSAVTAIDIQIDHNVQKNLAPSLTSAQFIYNLQQPNPHDPNFLSPSKAAANGTTSSYSSSFADTTSSSPSSPTPSNPIPALSKGIFARVRIEFSANQAKLVRHQNTIDQLNEYFDVTADPDLLEKDIPHLDRIQHDYQQYLYDDQEYIRRLVLPSDKLVVLTVIASLTDLSQSNLLYHLENKVKMQQISYGFPQWTSSGLNGSLLFWLLLRPCWYTWLRGGLPLPVSTKRKNMQGIIEDVTDVTASGKRWGCLSGPCACCTRTYWRTKGPKFIELTATLISILSLLGMLRSTYMQLPEYQNQINQAIDSFVTFLGPRITYILEIIMEWMGLIFNAFGPLFTNLVNILYRFGNPIYTFLSTLLFSQNAIIRFMVTLGSKVLYPLYTILTGPFRFLWMIITGPLGKIGTTILSIGYKVYTVIGTRIALLISGEKLRYFFQTVVGIVNVVLTFFQQVLKIIKPLNKPVTIPPIEQEPGAYVHIASAKINKPNNKKPKERPSPNDKPNPSALNNDAPSGTVVVSTSTNLHPSSTNIRHRNIVNGLPPRNPSKGISPQKSTNTVTTSTTSPSLRSTTSPLSRPPLPVPIPTRLETLMEDGHHDPVEIDSPAAVKTVAILKMDTVDTDRKNGSRKSSSSASNDTPVPKDTKSE